MQSWSSSQQVLILAGFYTYKTCKLAPQFPHGSYLAIKGDCRESCVCKQIRMIQPNFSNKPTNGENIWLFIKEDESRTNSKDNFMQLQSSKLKKKLFYFKFLVFWLAVIVSWFSENNLQCISSLLLLVCIGQKTRAVFLL